MSNLKNKNKQQMFPRALLKSLAADITLLTSSNEGRLLAMEIMDEVPYEVRPQMLDGLSAFYEPEMMTFFRLVIQEYPELEADCNRALGKLALAGVQENPEEIVDRVLYKILAYRTRHLGQIKLEIAYLRPLELMVEAEVLELAFNSDGIASFSILPNLALSEFEAERSIGDGIIELDLTEAGYLIQEAYRQNVHYMTPPALGRFIYQRYLEGEAVVGRNDQVSLIRKLMPQLSALETVNTFLHSSRLGDDGLLDAICLDGTEAFSAFPEFTSEAQMLMEAHVTREVREENMAMLFVNAVSACDDEVYSLEYVFTLVKRQGDWWISHINRYRKEQLHDDSPENPYNHPVFCQVHQLLDVDNLFNGLEAFEDVREIGELPYGSHLRLAQMEYGRSHGVTFMTGILADIVINGEEIVIIAEDESTARQVGEALVKAEGSSLMQEYTVDVVTAYSYISGEYETFEEALRPEDSSIIEDNMKFITIRYLTSDQDKVKSKLNQLTAKRFKLSDCQAFYLLDHFEGQEILLAEYLVGDNWVSISSFGDVELTRQRSWFEDNLRTVLEYDGVQLREGGLLGLLDPDTRRSLPELETFLKDMYLNRWYLAKHVRLNGMSPYEAEQSDEGRQLLWSLVKEMRKREKKGSGGRLPWRDYISRVDLGGWGSEG
ncbi:MAG: hypothetical protein ACM3NT_03870 [Methylocystaceae bacterium]